LAKSGRLKIAIAVILVAVAAGTVYLLLPQEAMEEPALVERMAFPLPDKPSIAVLPFTNMSADPEQEYFVDGMTEDLITDLSKISGLFVIARNSTFSYKGKPVKVRQVAEELGVRYVLEGSMRRDGNQVRINAQLIDAITGGHLWAERYDGSIDNVFELQDKVTRQIVTALAVNLTTDEDVRRGKGKTNIPEAYDAFLQGRAHFRQYTRKDIAFALDYFMRAVELDPNYTHAFAAISQVYTVATSRGWHSRLGWCRAPYRAESFLQLSMKNPTALTHRAASLLRSRQGRHKEALEEAAKMMVLDPNDAENFDALGEALLWAGRPKEAIEAYEKAMRLDPHYPAQYLEGIGVAYFNAGQIEMAEEALAKARNLNPSIAAWTHIAVLGLLGRKDEATAIHEQYLKLRKLKRYSVDRVVGWYPYERREDVERLGSGLIKAGFCCQDRLEQYLTTTPRAQESFTRFGC
jgi:TolB-like protein